MLRLSTPLPSAYLLLWGKISQSDLIHIKTVLRSCFMVSNYCYSIARQINYK
ncbi:protein of unknown function [Vibrio tapetis subsp. tapetis]|uniref:Uncharacterized protein n=1 Tax=Vibrio tapetis subsp. tapetis TaxID=1671868 RepID=A0A2N8ZCP6_9VIBR|nr:protein of unknown function [Vibrio tapetis subsp. tapetis]